MYRYFKQIGHLNVLPHTLSVSSIWVYSSISHLLGSFISSPNPSAEAPEKGGLMIRLQHMPLAWMVPCRPKWLGFKGRLNQGPACFLFMSPKMCNWIEAQVPVSISFLSVSQHFSHGESSFPTLEGDEEQTWHKPALILFLESPHLVLILFCRKTK